jgi:GNAT superfamily N-acetyltransferase
MSNTNIDSPPPKAFFAAREHQLTSCSLLPLTADTATAAAQRLADLDPWLTLGYPSASLANYLKRSDASLHRFMISASGQEAGIVCCRYPWLFGPFLELLALYPQFQGHGCGREILDWLEEPAAFANLWTTVSSFNLRALNFYIKFGFVEIGPLKNLVRSGFDEILLRKIIRNNKP